MELDFKPGLWLQAFADNPVVVILLFGLLSGNGFAQAVKLTYLGFGDPEKITRARYRATMNWLAITSTFLFTYLFWRSYAPQGAHGLERLSSLGTGFSSPFVYKAVRALADRFCPGFAAKWGDNGEAWKEA
jgi:hypothetical protein